MRYSKAIIFVALCILLLSFAAPAQKRKGSAAKPARKPVAVVAPIDTDKLKTLLTQQREHPLLVNFWATFCDPCRDEFVTVSLDDVSEIKNEVPKFLDLMKATMPAYLLDVSDPEPAIDLVDRRWQGDLPATFLYNEKGEMVYRHIGRVDPVKLREAIEKVVTKGDAK
jgi:thiol-disulfide isomerase/thioredoxin